MKPKANASFTKSCTNVHGLSSLAPSQIHIFFELLPFCEGCLSAVRMQHSLNDQRVSGLLVKLHMSVEQWSYSATSGRSLYQSNMAAVLLWAHQNGKRRCGSFPLRVTINALSLSQTAPKLKRPDLTSGKPLELCSCEALIMALLS